MRQQQAGVSLIETLVTLVIISIGMLGIAALYVESLRLGFTALSRTRAVSMAADMADRIRSNPAGAVIYDVDATPVGSNPPTDCAETATAAAANCTPDELAGFDIWQWKTLIGNSSDESAQQLGLPGGIGVVTRDDSTLPATIIITVSWTEREEPLSYSIALAN